MEWQSRRHILKLRVASVLISSHWLLSMWCVTTGPLTVLLSSLFNTLWRCCFCSGTSRLAMNHLQLSLFQHKTIELFEFFLQLCSQRWHYFRCVSLFSINTVSCKIPELHCSVWGNSHLQVIEQHYSRYFSSKIPRSKPKQLLGIFFTGKLRVFKLFNPQLILVPRHDSTRPKNRKPPVHVTTCLLFLGMVTTTVYLIWLKYIYIFFNSIEKHIQVCLGWLPSHPLRGTFPQSGVIVKFEIKDISKVCKLLYKGWT